MSRIHLRRGALAALALAVGALALAAAAPAHRTGHGHRGHHGLSPDLEAVKAATASFRDVEVAKAHGYTVEVADVHGVTCIAQPGVGAMGVRYLNPSLVDGEIVATRPELMVYEPGTHGALHLVAVEYLVLQDAWNAHHHGPPTLFGQTFMATPAPNRFGLPPYYSLHAWIWKRNPSGMFAMWNPTVSCP